MRRVGRRASSTAACNVHPRTGTRTNTTTEQSPNPPRPVTRLDELRALIRWRHRHNYPEDFDDEDSDDSAAR
jgi:hypothetical protein